MFRQIVYPGQIPLDTDVLNSQKNGYIGLAKLAQGLFGNNTVVNGLSCVPNSPAALNVLVNPGEIYAIETTDTSAYGSLGTDATSILKQGILFTQQTLSTPAPGTAGQSINYLIEATFTSADANSTVLPYYNASNPSVAWSGPNNTGTAQNTQRQDLCQLTVKAGTAATTGSQATPAPDANYVGLWVVTVANGQTTVTSSNITAYTGAPFLHGPNNNPLFPVSNYLATVDPTTTNDNTQGYIIGSEWLNTTTNVMWACLNASTGAAIWRQDTSAPAPNFFVDPCCRVAQGATASLSTSRQWGAVDLVECWATGTAVSAGTIGQDTATTAGGITPFSCAITGATITGSGNVFFRRFIESNDALSLVNQTAVFSLTGLQNTGSAINVTITVNKATAQNNFASVTNIATSSSISLASGVAQRLVFSLPMGACGNGVEVIVQMACGAVTTKAFYTTDWRAAIGTVDGAFRIPFFNEDYMNTLRYFEKSYPYGTAPGSASPNGIRTFFGAITVATGSAFKEASIVYKVTKVGSPSIVNIYDPSGNLNKILDVNASTSIAVTPSSSSSDSMFGINNNTGSNSSADISFQFHFSADARL